MGHPDLSGPSCPVGPVLLNVRVSARATITGVERWTTEVVPRLVALEPDRYRVVRPRPRLQSRVLGQTWEQVGLPALARQAGASLVFSPANLAPLAWPRNVLVMHDAAVLREPHAYSRTYRAWHRTFGLAAARRAIAVITVSEFSRGELISLAGLDPERVFVVPGGVSSRFHPAVDYERVRRSLGLTKPYVLTIATADRRKNLESLTVAAARIAELGMELVWAGESRPYFSEVGAVAGIRSLGYVDDADLPGLYAGARAFVLPSRYEGFGLTCLEAMASGVPVVAANRAALPETCGDAALLVDPDSPVALWAALVRVVTKGSLRDHLVRSGIERVAGFAWNRAAKATHTVLMDVVRD